MGLQIRPCLLQLAFEDDLWMQYTVEIHQNCASSYTHLPSLTVHVTVSCIHVQGRGTCQQLPNVDVRWHSTRRLCPTLRAMLAYCLSMIAALTSFAVFPSSRIPLLSSLPVSSPLHSSSFRVSIFGSSGVLASPTMT